MLRQKNKRILAAVLATAALAALMTGCGQSAADEAIKLPPAAQQTVDIHEQTVAMQEAAVAKESKVEVEADEEAIKAEAEALAESIAAMPLATTVEASGVDVKKSGAAVIDYSNISDGYVMVNYEEPSAQRLKAQVKGPSTTYTYNLTPEKWAAFPLSDGNGEYQIVVYQNVTGTKYAALLSLTVQAELEDEFGPFLRSNQYVDFDSAPETVAKAAEITKDMEDPLEKVEAVYDYVVKGLTYDKELAATVKSGYLPVLDEVLEKGKGICFDYAALMTGMLRSQDVPCKLVVGYAGKAYHAWISVWSEHDGWIDGVIWFDGESWQRMDPTFASSGKGSDSIMAYIGDGKNYSAKYFY
ncbi:MAG: transglutaminase domain-containing protein [Oscillospiraceae bacterium]|nr:transglutaminase domain-containing protein [Oscillospiraceae bacterium]